MYIYIYTYIYIYIYVYIYIVIHTLHTLLTNRLYIVNQARCIIGVKLVKQSLTQPFLTTSKLIIKHRELIHTIVNTAFLSIIERPRCRARPCDASGRTLLQKPRTGTRIRGV